MPVKKGDFIKVSYTGRVKGGDIFDTTDEKVAKEAGIFNENVKYGAQLIVVGSEYAVKGLEEDILGENVGYKGTVEIPPEKGFGAHDPKLIETFSITKFKERPLVGARVNLNGRMGTVATVIGRRARVDFNHPLAGKTIVYDYTIEEEIKTPKSKISELIDMYARADLDVDIKESVAVVNVPYALSFDQRWLLSKKQIADDILAHTGIKEVQYVEKHTVAKKPTKKPAKKTSKPKKAAKK
ncbi:MAG: FKBP-type peptidyl-prolyl cis-trans isomerase [Methanocellales archaeon]|nr:FKBP-type peptidyl-prolyl cis-trans isomerase [Methanocellales archaeon]